MDCPTFKAGKTERVGELKPFSCPLIYCEPRPDVQNSGNFTFSICTKEVDEINSELYSDIEKRCITDYKICESSCQTLKGESISPVVSKPLLDNTTTYTAVGCIEGDYSGVKNKSSLFPLSSIVQSKVDPIRELAVLESSANQLYNSMMISWIFMVALFTIYFAKKL